MSFRSVVQKRRSVVQTCRSEVSIIEVWREREGVKRVKRERERERERERDDQKCESEVSIRSVVPKCRSEVSIASSISSAH